MEPRLLLTLSAEGEPVEKLDLDILARALGRLQREQLDLNHFNPGEFVNGECWVVMDVDLCTIAMSTTFPGVLEQLAKGL